jgi:hypothetical protein
MINNLQPNMGETRVYPQKRLEDGQKADSLVDALQLLGLKIVLI